MAEEKQPARLEAQTPSPLVRMADDTFLHVVNFLASDISDLVTHLWLPGLCHRLVRLAKAGALNRIHRGVTFCPLHYTGDDDPVGRGLTRLMLALVSALAPTVSVDLTWPVIWQTTHRGTVEPMYQRGFSLVLSHPAWRDTTLHKLVLSQDQLTPRVVGLLRTMRIRALAILGPYCGHAVKPLKGPMTCYNQQAMHGPVDALLLLLTGGDHSRDILPRHLEELGLYGCQFTRGGHELKLNDGGRVFYPVLHTLHMQGNDGGMVVARALLNPLAAPALRSLRVLDTNLGQRLATLSNDPTTMSDESEYLDKWRMLIEKNDIANTSGPECDRRVIMGDGCLDLKKLYAIEAAHGTTTEALYTMDSMWLHRLTDVVLLPLPIGPDVRALADRSIFPYLETPHTLPRVPPFFIRASGSELPHFASAECVTLGLLEDLAGHRNVYNLPLFSPDPKFALKHLHTLSMRRNDLLQITYMFRHTLGARANLPVLRHVVATDTARALGHGDPWYRHACALCFAHTNASLRDAADIWQQCSHEAGLPMPAMHMVALEGLVLDTDCCTTDGRWHFHHRECNLDQHGPYYHTASIQAARAAAGNLFAWRKHKDSNPSFSRCYVNLHRFWLLMCFPFVRHNFEYGYSKITGETKESHHGSALPRDVLVEVLGLGSGEYADRFLAPLRMLGLAWLSSMDTTPLHEREALGIEALAHALTLHWSISFPITDGILGHNDMFSAPTFRERVQIWEVMTRKLWWRVQVVTVLGQMRNLFNNTCRIPNFYAPTIKLQDSVLAISLPHAVSQMRSLLGCSFAAMCQLLRGRIATTITLAPEGETGHVFTDPVLNDGGTFTAAVTVPVPQNSFGVQLLADTLRDLPEEYEIRSSPVRVDQSQLVPPLAGRKRAAELQLGPS